MGERPSKHAGAKSADMGARASKVAASAPLTLVARRAGSFIVMAFALAAAVMVSVLVGASDVGAGDLLRLMTGAPVADHVRAILLNVRVPRVAAALLAGAALAASGAIIQGVLNNPLASPNVLGINAGAGLAVLIASSAASQAVALLPLAAFAGALGTAFLVFVISIRAGSGKLTVVLAGMAMTAVFTAGMNAVLIFDPDAYVGSARFLTGGLAGVQMSDLAWPCAYIALGLAIALGLCTRLNALSLGDETAHSLGMNVQATRMGALAVAAVLAGAAVSFAGLLGFVGLVVPHIVRSLLGRDYRLVVPASVLSGALLVVVGDLLARTLFSPFEIPVGIFMAFIGGPFFIYLIVRERGSHV